MGLYVDPNLCTGCKACERVCSLNVLRVDGLTTKVLDSYCNSCFHCIAVCPNHAISTDACADNSEAVRELVISGGDQMMNTIKTRRSIRVFAASAVEDSDLDRIIAAGSFAPTGGNLQPLNFIAVRESLGMLTKMASKSLFELAQKMEGRPGVNPHYIKKWNAIYELNKQGRDSLFYNAPAVIVITGDMNISPACDLEGGIAAGYMALAAHSMGLGTCINGFFVLAAQKNSEIRELLQLKDNEKILSSMAVGYPGIEFIRTVPKNIRSVRRI